MTDISSDDLHFFNYFYVWKLIPNLLKTNMYESQSHVGMAIFLYIVLWISSHILTELSWYGKSLYELYSHKKYKNVLKDFLFLTQNYHQTFLCLLDIHVIEKHMQSIKIILKKMKKIKAIYGIMRCKQNYSLTLLKPFINFSVFGIITATAYITTRNYTKTMTSRHNFQFYVKC